MIKVIGLVVVWSLLKSFFRFSLSRDEVIFWGIWVGYFLCFDNCWFIKGFDIFMKDKFIENLGFMSKNLYLIDFKYFGFGWGLLFYVRSYFDLVVIF